MTLKNKVVAFFVIFLTSLLTFFMFLSYNTVKDEVEKESLNLMALYCRSIERILAKDGLAGMLTRISDGLVTESIRITIVDEDGAVLYESPSYDSTLMDNHLNRPEIRIASRDGTGSALRYSNTMRVNMLYYALKTEYEQAHLFIRTAMPLSPLSGILAAFIRRVVLTMILVGIVGLISWIWLTKRLFHPLEEIVRLAELTQKNQNAEMVESNQDRFPIFRELELQRLSTALNAMSEHLGNANANIQARRDELSRIVDALPIGVVVIGADRRVRYLNGVTRSLLGESGGVVKGSPVELLIPSGEIYDVLNGPDACRTVFLPPQPAHFNGNGVMVDVCAVTLGSGRLMTLRDVTEERRLEEIRRNFTIDAGHELQTPLTAIRAAAELLLEDADESEEPEKIKLLSTVMRQQERMTSLIDDLLLLVKLESGEPANRTDEDLMEMLSMVVDEFRENPAARYVTFDLTGPSPVSDMGGPTAPFKANRPELLRAFSNIVDNAVRKCGEKYGEEGGGRVRLSLRKEESVERAEWVVTFEDNGSGVNPETAAMIFKEFQSSGARREKWGKGGHGLGLSIATRIIKAHGGVIDLLTESSKSSPNAAADLLGGAVFEVRLPAESQDR